MSQRNAQSDNEPASLLPFGRCPAPGSPLAPPLSQFGQALYRKVRTEYERAGAPHGPSDEAMLIWYTFQADIAAFGPAADGHPVLPVHWN